jgi:flagellar protein FlbD
MIYVTRLNHTSIVLNCDLIEHVETTPDTVISLTTGQKIMVLESPEEIVDRVVQFRRKLIRAEATHLGLNADSTTDPYRQVEAELDGGH